MDTESMLAAYGMSSAFPEKWENSGVTSALASLEASDARDGVNVDELLDTLASSHSVAQDELDPLGSGRTVLQLLAANGIVPKTAAERAVYLPSSTSFDAKKFLADCHPTASLADLEQGLTYLRHKLTQAEQGGRAETVDNEYEEYVHSKQRLDEVMGELAEIGCTEETGFSMQKLRAQLDDARNELAIRARPIEVATAEKQRLQNALEAMEQHRDKLEVPQLLARLCAQNEHDQFLREYKRGTRLLQSTWALSDDTAERQLAHFLLAETQKVREQYIDKLRAELMKTPADGAYAPLITQLTDLGDTQNPALEWLEHNIEQFSKETNALFDAVHASAQRHYAEASESGQPVDMISYLRLLVEDSDPQDLYERLGRETGIDSETVVLQWTQLVDSFEQLRRVLNRASVFFQEFISLQNSGSWQLTPMEIAMVTKHCQELISGASRGIVESLTRPVARSMALPIATQHESAGPGEPAFLPYNSNSLAVAKYLARIFDILVLFAAQVTELAPGDNKPVVFDAVQQVRQQFVKTLCGCWTRDAQQFGAIQQWTRLDSLGSLGAQQQPKLPQYFAAFHGIMLEHLRILLDPARFPAGDAAPLVAYIVRVFPAALSLSIKSIETELVESSKKSSLADSQQAELRAQLLPASLSQDAKLLITLNYLEALRHKSLNRIYAQFDSVFSAYRVSTSLIEREITPEVDKISGQLFDIYIRKNRSKLSQIVSQEIQRLVPIWRESREVQNISNYIYESLMVLVDTHALFTESCPQMTRPAVLELYKHLLTTILGQLREIDALNRFGTLQNIADLEFMRWALSQLKEGEEIAQLIFVTIRNISTDDQVWRIPSGPREAVKGPLTDAIRQCQFAFLAFRSFQ